MKQNETNLVPKSSKIYECKHCDYITLRISQYERHNSTLKHQKRSNETNPNQMKHFSSKKFQCLCGLFFESRSTLWRHKQKCNVEPDVVGVTETIQPVNETIMLSNLVLEVVKNNSELQKQCMELQKQNNDFQQKVIDSFHEVYKNGINNTSNSHNVNSNNKSFNLNFFLNETCKHAMNITDFVNSIQLQLTDLENLGENGFVNGISNIIVKNLKNLDITQRPVHCTDPKREVLYIKDENKWEKESEENNKLRKVIKHIAYKNTKMLSAFREKHPDCGKSESIYSDQYNKLIIEAMGGRGDNDIEKENKIIQKIAKEVLIQK